MLFAGIFSHDPACSILRSAARLLPETSPIEPMQATRMPVWQELCEAGATGLEPATSGVTGLFHQDDDWRRLTHYRSIHAGLQAQTSDFHTIAQARFGAFAALLLPRRVEGATRRRPCFNWPLSGAFLGGTGRGRSPLGVVAAASGESTLAHASVRVCSLNGCCSCSGWDLCPDLV